MTDDGAWCWFADPRAVYYTGKLDRTYVGWVNKAGDIKLAAVDNKTSKIETVTLKKNLQKDDHANPALLVRDDGRIVVFYSAHNGDKMFYRISKKPEDISSWSDEMSLAANTQGKYGFTYPNPCRLTKENEIPWLNCAFGEYC